MSNKPTNLDFSIAYSGLRLQALNNNLDPNTKNMTAFLTQTAEVLAAQYAQNRKHSHYLNRKLATPTSKKLGPNDLEWD